MEKIILRRVLVFVTGLTLSTVAFCHADLRLARTEDNVLLLTTLDDEGGVKKFVTCVPRLPNGAKLSFSETGKGVLIEIGVTNQITTFLSSVVSNLNTTYNLDIVGLPEALLGGKLEYAVRNASGNKIAVLMAERSQLYILDNEFEVLTIIEGTGIQCPAWSLISDKLVFWLRGTHPHPSVDDFAIKAARVTNAGVSIVDIAPAGGGMDTRRERKPPVWNAGSDVFWCDPYTNHFPQSHLITLTEDQVTTNALPPGLRMQGAVPNSTLWYALVSGEEGVKLASNQGQIISQLGSSRYVYRAISSNLFLTSKIGPPPASLTVSKPGWIDVGTIPYGNYWLVNEKVLGGASH